MQKILMTSVWNNDKNDSTNDIMNDSYGDSTNKYLSNINDILTVINETCIHWKLLSIVENMYTARIIAHTTG